MSARIGFIKERQKKVGNGIRFKHAMNMNFMTGVHVHGDLNFKERIMSLDLLLLKFKLLLPRHTKKEKIFFFFFRMEFVIFLGKKKDQRLIKKGKSYTNRKKGFSYEMK